MTSEGREANFDTNCLKSKTEMSVHVGELVGSVHLWLECIFENAALLK